MVDSEQKLKFSVSNIISFAAILLTMVAGYITLTNQIAEQRQRINNLEKTNDENRDYRVKVDAKLDKIIESVNQIKVDVAGHKK